MEMSQNIFIKLENQKEVKDFLNKIKNESKQIKELFKIYEKLSSKQSSILNNWETSITNIQKKLDEIEI